MDTISILNNFLDFETFLFVYKNIAYVTIVLDCSFLDNICCYFYDPF